MKTCGCRFIVLPCDISKPPYLAFHIPGSFLDFAQDTIGGHITLCFTNQDGDVAAYGHDEGLLRNLPINQHAAKHLGKKCYGSLIIGMEDDDGNVDIPDNVATNPEEWFKLF